MGEMTVKHYVEKLNQHEPDAMKRAELFHKNTERNIKLDEDIERRIEKLVEVADA